MAKRNSSLRPSRDERAPYISAINDAFADGRIDEAEQTDRIELAEAAVSFDDLDDLVADIPFEWHDAELEKTKRAGRRGFLFGAAGIVLVGAASWAGTRTWVESSEVSAAEPAGDDSSADTETTQAADGAASDGPSPAETDASEDDVPTELVQVELWTKDAMTTAMDFAATVGMTAISDVNGSDGFLRVEGRSKKRGPLAISFSRDRRPEVEELDLVAEETVSPKKLRGLDLAKLHDEAKKAADLGSDVTRHYLRIEHWPDLWTIGIRGADDSEVYWRIDGTTRYDPDRDYFGF